MSIHTFESPNGDSKPGESRSYYLEDDRLAKILERTNIKGISLGQIMVSQSEIVADPRIHEVSAQYSE